MTSIKRAFCKAILHTSRLFNQCVLACVQAAMDKTNEIMNKVAASEATWDAIRPALAEQYREAGQSGVADFVLAA